MGVQEDLPGRYGQRDQLFNYGDPPHSAQVYLDCTRAKLRIYYIWMWQWMLWKNPTGSKGGSSLKEPVFSRRSGWEWEAQCFCAFSQSLSSLCRPSLLPREVPGGLQASFDPHQPGSLGQISQCNHLCFKVLRGNSSAPFPFHGMTSAVATIALRWHRPLSNYASLLSLSNWKGSR